jgi:hypothetical protein
MQPIFNVKLNLNFAIQATGLQDEVNSESESLTKHFLMW